MPTPGPVIHGADHTPTPLTPSSGPQVAQSMNDTASDDHDASGESAAVASGPTSNDPATSTTAAPSDRLSPAPDITAVPAEALGEGNTDVGVKKARKGKRFRPSVAKSQR